MIVAIRSLPFLWRGLLITLEVSAIVVAVALIAGVLLGTAHHLWPDLAAPARPPLQRHRARHSAAGADLLRLLRLTRHRLEHQQLLGRRRRPGRVRNRPRAGGRAWRTAIHPSRPDRGRTRDRPDLPAAHAVRDLPQALRRFLPPWINTVVDTVKGSALVSLVGIVDLMLAIQQVIGRTFRPMPLYVLGALIYFAINYALSLASRRLERRFAYIREH